MSGSTKSSDTKWWAWAPTRISMIGTVLFVIGCVLTIANVEIVGLVFMLVAIGLGIYDAYKHPRTWKGEPK